MCGYRLYPLSQVMPILTRYAIGKRMSFDTDILVKLVWSGCRVSHILPKWSMPIPSHLIFMW